MPYIHHMCTVKAKTTQQWRSGNVAWSLGTPWERVRCNCGVRMVYKALYLCTYGILFLSIAYQLCMNGVHFASMAYRGVCTAYELCTDYAPCAAVALPLRRCCVVEYFAALHEYLLRQHDDHRQKTYTLLFVLILFIVMDLSQTQADAGSREWQLTVLHGLVRWMQ